MQRHSVQLLHAVLQTARQAAVNPKLINCQSSAHYLPSISCICLRSTYTTSPYHKLLHSTHCHSPALPQYAWQQLQCRGFAAQTQARPQSRALKTGLHRAAPSGTQALYLLAFTVAMIGVTYASVPLYRMFCQATGYGGTVQQGSTGTVTMLKQVLAVSCIVSPSLQSTGGCLAYQLELCVPHSLPLHSGLETSFPHHYCAT